MFHSSCQKGVNRTVKGMNQEEKELRKKKKMNLNELRLFMFYPRHFKKSK